MQLTFAIIDIMYLRWYFVVEGSRQVVATSGLDSERSDLDDIFDRMLDLNAA